MQKTHTPTLYLTADEKKIVTALPKDILGAWKIEDEKGTFEDTAEKRNARLQTMKLEDKNLLKLQQEAQGKEMNEQSIEAMAHALDLSKISQHDMIELSFAWGPSLFTAMIGAALKSVSTKDDVSALAALCFLRHGLFMSFGK